MLASEQLYVLFVLCRQVEKRYGVTDEFRSNISCMRIKEDVNNDCTSEKRSAAFRSDTPSDHFSLSKLRSLSFLQNVTEGIVLK